jgi:hypothetical protein
MTALHERKAIRDAVVAQLSGQTAAGARVFASRQSSVKKVELPAICVYTDSEEVDEESADSSPRWLKRKLLLAVEVWAGAASGVDDVLDALALEVETAMDSDDSLGGTAFWSWPASTEVGLTEIGNQPVGCCRMLYTVVYKTDLRTETRDGAFDDLKTVDTTYDVAAGEQDPADRSETLNEGLDA